MADPATIGAGIGTAAAGALAFPGPVDDIAVALIGSGLIANEVRKGIQSGAYVNLNEAFTGVMKTIQFPGGGKIDTPTETPPELLGKGVIQEPGAKQGSLTDVLEQLIPQQQDPRAGILDNPVPELLREVPGRTEFPSEGPKFDPVMRIEGNKGKSKDDFPIRNENDFPVDKITHVIKTGENIAVPRGSMHFDTVPRGTKGHEIIRGFVNEKQKTFGTRIIDPKDDFLVSTQEELDKVITDSLDQELDFAKKFFKAHPDFKFFIPSLTNNDVGRTEMLDKDTFTDYRVLTKEQVFGKPEEAKQQLDIGITPATEELPRMKLFLNKSIDLEHPESAQIFRNKIWDKGETDLKKLFIDIPTVDLTIEKTIGDYYGLEPTLMTHIEFEPIHREDVKKRISRQARTWRQDTVHMSEILSNPIGKAKQGEVDQEGFSLEPQVTIKFDKPLTDKQFKAFNDTLREKGLAGSTLLPDKTGVFFYNVSRGDFGKSPVQFREDAKNATRGLNSRSGEQGLGRIFKGNRITDTSFGYRRLLIIGNPNSGATRTYKDISGGKISPEAKGK